MTLRLRDELFFPNSFIVDRFFDDDDLELIETFVVSFPRRKRPRIEQKQIENQTSEPDKSAKESVALPQSRILPSFFNLDMVESENDYKIHVDLPGVNPEDLDVSITNKFLVIKAERKSSHEEKTSKVHSVERVYGKTERKIRLPNNVDVDQSETKLKNGVLTITFPKKEKETVRKITVQCE